MNESSAASPNRLFELIKQYRDSLPSDLGDEGYKLLGARVRAYAEAPRQDRRAVRRALQGVRLVLIELLPAEHPVRQALDTTRLATGQTTAPDPGKAAELLGMFPDLAAPAGPGGATAPDTATIIAEARHRLLQAPSLSAEEVRAQSGRVPLPGLIRLMDPQRGARYPAFQFTATEGTPHEVVLKVNRLLFSDIDPWGAADWWLSGNLWLGGQPASLIGEVADSRLVRAATALLEGI
ncbi:hypothetical protein ABTX35_05450 [Streptomyces sp. NPDC096080]|uniref:hypothetical protein n=1 Tax=Streptomyces sp. NPDC096080 TaxID=3156693 RepID=UPI003317103C